MTAGRINHRGAPARNQSRRERGHRRPPTGGGGPAVHDTFTDVDMTALDDPAHEPEAGGPWTSPNNAHVIVDGHAVGAEQISAIEVPPNATVRAKVAAADITVTAQLEVRFLNDDNRIILGYLQGFFEHWIVIQFIGGAPDFGTFTQTDVVPADEELRVDMLDDQVTFYLDDIEVASFQCDPALAGEETVRLVSGGDWAWDYFEATAL